MKLIKNLVVLAGLPGFSALLQAQQTCNASIPASTPTADFTDNGNGTVTHSRTGLMWKRCAEGQTWSGTTCTGSAIGTGSWTDALKSAVSATTGGYSDWRLPNLKELQSIVEYKCYSPSINASIFPNTPEWGFWSASAHPWYNLAWYVFFDVGYANGGYRDGGNRVRLVRAGQSFGAFDSLGTMQAITGFAPTTPVALGAAPATLSATGGASGNPVVFATSSAASICTVSGITLTYVGVGVCNLTANQAGGGSYNAAPQLTASVIINATAQAITGFAPTTPVVFGAAPATLTASGGASGNPVVFATGSAASICTVSGTTLTYVGVGVCNLTANQAGGNGYSAAPQVTASVTITAPVSAPICSLTAVPARVVPGRPSTLTASCSPAAVTYTWTGGNCPAGTGHTCTDAPAVTTLYGVTGSNSFGSSNAATTTVTVKSVDLPPILMLLLD